MSREIVILNELLMLNELDVGHIFWAVENLYFFKDSIIKLRLEKKNSWRSISFCRFRIDKAIICTTTHNLWEWSNSFSLRWLQKQYVWGLPESSKTTKSKSPLNFVPKFITNQPVIYLIESKLLKVQFLIVGFQNLLKECRYTMEFTGRQIMMNMLWISLSMKINFDWWTIEEVLP